MQEAVILSYLQPVLISTYVKSNLAFHVTQLEWAEKVTETCSSVSRKNAALCIHGPEEGGKLGGFGVGKLGRFGVGFLLMYLKLGDG